MALSMLVKPLLRKFSISKRVFVLFFCILFFLSLFFFLNRFFLIKTIKVIGEGEKLSLIKLGDIKNKNILLLSKKKLAEEILKNNPLIKKVSIEKQLPNVLGIKVDFYQPIAILKVNGGYFFMADNGKIINKKKEKNFDLPLINYYQQFNYSQFQLGEKISFKDILIGLFFLKKVNELGLKVDEVEISGFNMIVLNIDKKKIIFSAEKETKTQEYQLEMIIRQFKIEGKTFKVLDFRFDKVGIKF